MPDDTEIAPKDPAEVVLRPPRRRVWWPPVDNEIDTVVVDLPLSGAPGDSGNERLEAALRAVGAEHDPPSGWEDRVLALRDSAG